MITVFFKDDYLSEKDIWQIASFESQEDSKSFLKLKNRKFGRWFLSHEFKGSYSSHPKWIILHKFSPGINVTKCKEWFACEEVDPSKIAFYSNPEAHKAFRYFWMGETEFVGTIASKKSWWNKQLFRGGEEEPVYNQDAPPEFIEIARDWFSSPNRPAHWPAA